jgi:hypothetical protein
MCEPPPPTPNCTWRDNWAVQCCLNAGETLDQIDIDAFMNYDVTGCGRALAQAGCGGVNPMYGTDYGEFESGYTTAIIPEIAAAVSGHKWYQIECPPSIVQGGVGYFFMPSVCESAPYEITPPAQTSSTCMYGTPSGYVSLIIDPLGCKGGACDLPQ